MGSSSLCFVVVVVVLVVLVVVVLMVSTSSSLNWSSIWVLMTSFRVWSTERLMSSRSSMVGVVLSHS